MYGGRWKERKGKGKDFGGGGVLDRDGLKNGREEGRKGGREEGRKERKKEGRKAGRKKGECV